MPNQTQSATVVEFPSAREEHSAITPSIERLKKLKKSQSQLGKIQQDLEVLIDAMAQNPSILSRAANYWGKLPLWQKIIAGLIIAAPPLIIGIITQLIVCYVITAFFLASYIGSSVILDDHYSHTQHSTKNIKSGVTSLAEGLDSVTQSLEQISQDLADQVNLFSKENGKFGDNVEALSLRNMALKQEVEKLKETEKKLRQTQNELELTCNELKKSIKDQTALLDETQAALNKARIDYEKNQKDLEKANKQLGEIQEKFAETTNHYEKVLEALRTAVTELTENTFKEPQHQQAFYNKMQQIIENKDASFIQIFDRFSTAESELIDLKNHYTALIEQYEQLVAKQTSQLARIDKTSTLLGDHGFYAPPVTKSPDTAANQQLRI